MVDITEVIVETSLIASNVIDLPASYLEDCSEEELNQMVDIPLEGGLLDVEVGHRKQVFFQGGGLLTLSV